MARPPGWLPQHQAPWTEPLSVSRGAILAGQPCPHVRRRGSAQKDGLDLAYAEPLLTCCHCERGGRPQEATKARSLKRNSSPVVSSTLRSLPPETVQPVT